MHAKYEVYISYGSKVIAKVKVDNRQTNKQTERQTDRTKTICPPIIRSGGAHLEGRIDPGRIGNKGETTHGEGVKLLSAGRHVLYFYSFYYFLRVITNEMA